MRELKFRAWHKENKTMKNNIPIFDNFWEEGWYPEEEYEVMQYTGLKDTNGVEVYEGDVLTRPCQAKDGKPNGSKTKVVKWSEKTLSYNFRGGAWYVIGNIYEHPELLTPTSDE